VTQAMLGLMLAAGVVLVAFGCWLAWPPAGYIAAGAALIVIPVRWVRGGQS
jgi:hypothetical protein